MDVRSYLETRLPHKVSDLTKYLTSYTIATAVSFTTKGASSALIAHAGLNPAAISAGSSIICTASFFGIRWPLYRWLHEERYKKTDTSERERRIDLITTILSSVVTNTIGIGRQYMLIKNFKLDPALAGVVAQFIGGATGFVTKAGLDYSLGLVFPSEKSRLSENK